MKRTAMIGIVLATIAVLGVSAWGPGAGQGTFRNNDEIEESDLTGRLQLAENEFPVLVVGADQYQLMIPPALAAEIDVENNERISVTGYATEFSNPDLLGSTKVMHVRAIEADGEKVVLPEGAAGFGRGPGMMRGGSAGRPGMMGEPGMMGGYGPYSDDDTGRWGRRGQNAPDQGAPDQRPGTFGGRRR
ncbi:MAG: hypothetical protein ACOCYQ_06095 [Alkalispirochaeta sp.]